MKTRRYKNAFRQQLLVKINRLSGSVFDRQDLVAESSNQAQLQLNRALNVLVDERHIIKISHGLYAKAATMRFPDGETQTILQEDFEKVAIAALNKLGVSWEFSEAIQAYNRGDTTQVPVVFSVKLNSRFRGTIQAEGRTLLFEGNKNAR
jgi:hypothetical protein